MTGGNGKNNGNNVTSAQSTSFSSKIPLSSDINITETDDHYIVVDYEGQYANRSHCYPRDQYKIVRVSDGNDLIWQCRDESESCVRMTKLVDDTGVRLLRIVVQTNDIKLPYKADSVSPINYALYDKNWKPLDEPEFDVLWDKVLAGVDINADLFNRFENSQKISRPYMILKAHEVDIGYSRYNKKTFPNYQGPTPSFRYYVELPPKITKILDGVEYTVCNASNDEHFTSIDLYVSKGDTVTAKIRAMIDGGGSYYLYYYKNVLEKNEGYEWNNTDKETFDGVWRGYDPNYAGDDINFGNGDQSAEQVGDEDEEQEDEDEEEEGEGDDGNDDGQNQDS